MASNKLLLIQDVEDLGRSGDIVSVRPGYARNYLLPKGFAVVASANALKQQARLQEERKQRAIVERRESEELASQMIDLAIDIQVKVDQEGHMYGSVTAADIVSLIQEQKGLSLEKRNVQLKAPIKQLGSYDIPIKLKEGVTSQVKINVTAEEMK